MILLQTVAVAFAMFSALPVPQPTWNEKNMRYALCAFPLVGAVCGLVWLCLALLPLPELLRAAGFCLAPVLITGGIHLDGYADTCDALASYGDTAKKQAILQDPHCGAFAVIRLCTYFIANLALCATLHPTIRAVSCMGIGFLLSRALSGWAIATLPLAKDTGLAHTFATAADQKTVRWVLGVLAVLLMAAQALVGCVAGLAMAAAALLTLWRYAYVSKVQFGGLSGDLAGWFLQKCEFWQLAVLVTCQLLGVTV